MLHQYQIFASLLAAATASPLSINSPNNTTNSTIAKSFKEVPLSATLQYVECFEGFKCANLEVPLDYDNTSIGTTNVAFLKWETPKQPAKGDILINPGGPGDSGVQYVENDLEILIGLFGDSYNIVGMDPRGVNNSGPIINCFPGQPGVRDYYDSQYYLKYDPHSPAQLVEHFEDAGAFGDWCMQTLNETARYANTPATARDMLQYAELLSESQGCDKTEAKVDYYGVSYGSALGTTFATLYPDRVGRMIIDGVVDVEDYYGGSWTQNVIQADQAVDQFFQECFNAKSNCSFYRNESSPAEIQQRFDAVLADLEKAPIPVSDPNLVQFPTTITHIDARSLLLQFIYNGQTNYPTIADQFSLLEQRNASLIITYLALAGTPKGLTLPLGGLEAAPEFSPVQPKLIIACNDQHGNYNISTVEKWQEYVSTLEGISRYAGGVWAAVITLQCRKLGFVPPETQQFPGFKKDLKTANPILFTTNTIDPVASSADKMSPFFADSVVLKQHAIGHGMQVAHSNCTTGYLTKFMETGELPPKGTVCEIEDKYFQVTEEAGGPTVQKRGIPKWSSIGW
ncbi:hypothetical protein BDV96DRAFT_193162 [Lophiotrema nucula]|uniref:Alpha/Beta hydrolase protein n=1 Tax=Lophiotrema nucula TaxID=690887 RepID=A0A6A5YUX8_9PLEO|nr:hypothetical protein BDV96DRAFT_193162 [Lophiotrema nucula]